MIKKPIREKQHQLDPELYKGERPISFTLCIKNKTEFFVNTDRFNLFEIILLNELKNFDCLAPIYLFMPDHLHMILRGNNSDSDIKKCLDMFKQKSGYLLSKKFPDIKWQKDYYDHILRSEENLYIRIRYILNNPVRAELVKHWNQYPYKGSTLYNLNKWD